MRLDGDRRGYVIAVGDTNVEALERAEAAARLLDVEVERGVSCCVRPRALLGAARGRAQPAAIASAASRATRSRATSTCATTSTSRSTPRCGWPSSRPRRARPRRTS